MPDRKKQPALKRIENIQIPRPELVFLSNNIPVYSFNIGDQDVLKIRLIFEAGSWYQTKKLVSRYTAEMLAYGSGKFDAAHIATMLDSHGAFMDTTADNDQVHTNVYMLAKYASEIIPLIAEIIRNPVFPEREMIPLLANGRQFLEVNMQKVDYLAGINFKELLFGKNHPYGAWAKTEDFEVLQRSDMQEFYSQYYNPATCKIIVAGKVSDKIIQLLDKHFGDWYSEAVKKKLNYKTEINDEKFRLIPVHGAMQSSIRVGCLLFPKNHPDYLQMICLNTVFGGYFGSRLMRNIREDKGLTYGIGSGLVALKNEGFFTVYSDVKADSREQVVEEIFKEMKLLQNVIVSLEELETVKSYMLGSFLRSIDGPFAIEDRFVNSMDSGMEFSEYMNKFIYTLNTINSENLIDLARKYLNPDSMTVSVAGK